jgi:hypothetical protein
VFAEFETNLRRERIRPRKQQREGKRYPSDTRAPITLETSSVLEQVF